MLSLTVKTRKIYGKKVKQLRAQGLIPAVLYGPKIKPMALEVDRKEFARFYKEAGESSIIKLTVNSRQGELRATKNRIGEEEHLALIKRADRNPLSGGFLHVDFFQPLLSERVAAAVPLVFEGEPPAVKELGGTLVKNILELEVKALPQDLPKEIKVDVSGLKAFEDEILVKDLIVAKKVEISRAPHDVVAVIMAPEKVEEELESPIEEEVEKVERAAGADKEAETEQARPDEKAKKEEKREQ